MITRLMSLLEIAQYLGYNVDHFREMLPALMLKDAFPEPVIGGSSRRRRWDRQQIERWLARKQRPEAMELDDSRPRREAHSDETLRRRAERTSAPR